MGRLFLVLVLGLFLLGGTGAMAQSGHVMLGPDEVKWGAAPPSLSRGAMLANFGMGDTFDAGKLTPMRAGSLIVMPVGTNHFVETREETVVQAHGVGPWGVKYVNPEDDPSKK